MMCAVSSYSTVCWRTAQPTFGSVCRRMLVGVICTLYLTFCDCNPANCAQAPRNIRETVHLTCVCLCVCCTREAERIIFLFSICTHDMKYIYINVFDMCVCIVNVSCFTVWDRVKCRWLVPDHRIVWSVLWRKGTTSTCTVATVKCFFAPEPRHFADCGACDRI